LLDGARKAWLGNVAARCRAAKMFLLRQGSQVLELSKKHRSPGIFIFLFDKPDPVIGSFYHFLIDVVYQKGIFEPRLPRSRAGIFLISLIYAKSLFL
jgi:hypothetical protein